MALPVEFDVAAARESAMMIFWRKGYLATSLSDLLEAMGIARGSLDAAFGDKRRLFVQCLDLFAGQTQEVLTRTRARHAPIEALRRFLQRSFVRADGAHSGLGRMLVNTVTELAGVDHALSARQSPSGGSADGLRGVSLRGRIFACTRIEAGGLPDDHQ
jgi:TetR/AcrR family transcriptional regulator, transcriptional repressor for nem operon